VNSSKIAIPEIPPAGSRPGMRAIQVELPRKKLWIPAPNKG